MFDELDTNFKINKHFSEKFHLIKPQEIYLGHRADTVRKQGQLKQVLAADTKCKAYTLKTRKTIGAFTRSTLQYLVPALSVPALFTPGH